MNMTRMWLFNCQEREASFFFKAGRLHGEPAKGASSSILSLPQG